MGVYTFQTATLLEISYHGSIMTFILFFPIENITEGLYYTEW